MKNLTFEVHKYTPELNKVYSDKKDITHLFYKTTLLKLCKDYQYNCQVVRSTFQPTNTTLRHYKLVAIRPDGTTETRFCIVNTVQDALQQLIKAREYYNIGGTKLKLTRVF